MAAAEDRRERCEGCGRTVALESLTTVTMPDGEELACCPSCEPHARHVAEELASTGTNRLDCDGCTDRFPAVALEDVVLGDGTVVTVCPDCLRDVPGHSDGNADTAVEETTDDSSTTEIARRKDLCSQCHERFRTELYRVTTVDGRTEELCQGCLERARAQGVVADVAMRTSEARDVLGVDAGASREEIRVAFLTHIKVFHPDQDTGNHETFRRVKEAYDRLT